MWRWAKRGTDSKWFRGSRFLDVPSGRTRDVPRFLFFFGNSLSSTEYGESLGMKKGSRGTRKDSSTLHRTVEQVKSVAAPIRGSKLDTAQHDPIRQFLLGSWIHHSGAAEINCKLVVGTAGLSALTGLPGNKHSNRADWLWPGGEEVTLRGSP